MNIFVVNAGSSSIKYQLFRMPQEEAVCSGLLERIGLENAVVTHKTFTDGSEQVHRETLEIPDHEAGLQKVNSLLSDAAIGVVSNPAEIEVVGHRVVHGGERFAATTLIDQEVKAEIKKLFPLAPLHNPPNYQGIEVAEKIFPAARQVAVFDTAFHQSMPEKAFRYAIPGDLYTEKGIRAYGFHGTSHKYVADRAAEYLKKPDSKIISIHLGNGCSMAAIKNGQSVDTSMGFSPLSGLIMGTRSGDIDPAVILHLLRKEGYSPNEVDSLLNKKSGMLGLTGMSDMRDIGKAIKEGSSKAALAYEMYTYRIQKYIGAYAAALNGLDALVFTAGVGENDANLRQQVCENMDFLGIALEPEKNRKQIGNLLEISSPASKVKILVIPTREELEIARQCFYLLEAKQ